MKKLLLFIIILSMPFVIGDFTYNNLQSSKTGSSTISSLTIYNSNLTNFTGLYDTPSSYAGSSTKCVKVNAGETALEFGDCAVGGSGITSITRGAGLNNSGTSITTSGTINVNYTNIKLFTDTFYAPLGSTDNSSWNESYFLAKSIINLTTMDSVLRLNSNKSLLGGTPSSGGIEFYQNIPEAKGGMYWSAYENSSNSIMKVGWMVCHYNSSSGNGVHQHCSIETLDNTTGTPSINTHFAITYGRQQNIATVTFPTAYISDPLINNIFSLDADNLDMFSDLSTRIFASGQSTIGLSINNNTQNVTMTALGSSAIDFLDDINAYGKNITANFYKGNGTYLTGICLTNGTGCSATGGTYNVTYHLYAYNQTYTGGTYNITYNLNSYNHTLTSNAYTDNRTATKDLHTHSINNISGIPSCSATQVLTNRTGILTCVEDQTGAGSSPYSYNHTEVVKENATINNGIKYWYNMTYTAGTYNSTYALNSYNHTSILSALYGTLWYNHTVSTYNNYNSVWISTFNTTYSLWSYNQTYTSGTYNSTYHINSYNFSTISTPITGQYNFTTGLTVTKNQPLRSDTPNINITMNGSCVIITGITGGRFEAC